MTNMYHNQKGAATLLITVIMITTITLIILFAAGYNRIQEQVTSNSYQNNQAFEAAEAGLEFGIVYLSQNGAAILANPVSGYIQPYNSTNTQNVVLADGSKYSIVYTNPIASNYGVILITSTGTSSDGTSTRVTSQTVGLGSLLSAAPPIPLISKGNISMSGNTIISNPYTNSTVDSGGTVSFAGNAKTLITGGATGSSSGNINSDIQQSNSTIAAMSNTGFFQSYFGSSEATVSAAVAHTYTNSASTNYTSTLNGMTGTSIWITQSGNSQATLSGNVTIGSAANPVVLIVNGSLIITGNATIYGFVYIIGGLTTSISGNTIINGGIVTTDTLTLAGNTAINYNTSVLSALQQQLQTSYFAKVPGTWRDF
jgi:Tfp pilus assembly protein PilX